MPLAVTLCQLSAATSEVAQSSASSSTLVSSLRLTSAAAGPRSECTPGRWVHAATISFLRSSPTVGRSVYHELYAQCDQQVVIGRLSGRVGQQHSLLLLAAPHTESYW